MKSLLTRTATGLCLIGLLFVSLQLPFLFAGVLIVGAFYLLSIELPFLLKNQSLIIRFMTFFSVASAFFWLFRRAIADDLQAHNDLLFVLLSVIVFDTVSYLSGVFFGKHKIAPRITPGKTWEGLIGGFIGLFIFISLWNQLSWHLALFYTVILGIGAFFGDLYESWLKRKSGVKDSGAIFPGHGGLYDRVDSLIGAICIFGLVKWLLLGAYISI